MDTTSVLKSERICRKKFEFVCRNYNIKLGHHSKVMGILNVTEDSFSNDGIYKQPERALELALQMKDEGADVIDVGGESTRPGAKAITPEEEKARVIPVIKKLAKKVNIPISVDTYKSDVAQAALEEGASIVNDISGLKFDSQMGKVIARYRAGCILMHIKGTPQTMQKNPVYRSLIQEIIGGLRESLALAAEACIRRSGILIDPGIGFGKTTSHNLQIIKDLKEFASLGFPIMIGTSRKSFIGNVLNVPLGERLWGTAASVAGSILNGAHMVRVHDVKEMVQVIKLVDAILNS